MAEKWGVPKGPERRYATQLRKVARTVAAIMDPHIEGAVIIAPEVMAESLSRYSLALGPWAERNSGVMLKGVEMKNQRAWSSTSKELGALLRTDVAESTVGAMTRGLQAESVTLIKSLPIEAGERAQKLALEAVTGGRRVSEVAAELANTESITVNRATTIARTETAKANTSLTQARSNAVGATHYIWRDASDGDVRESHAEMDGKVFAFANPPELSDGTTGHPGEFPNCRCYPEPIIDSDDEQG